MRRLCRATYDRMFAGVCGGIANYFGIDSTLVRLATAVLVLAGGLSLWVYILAMIIMPVSADY